MTCHLQFLTTNTVTEFVTNTVFWDQLWETLCGIHSFCNGPESQQLVTLSHTFRKSSVTFTEMRKRDGGRANSRQECIDRSKQAGEHAEDANQRSGVDRNLDGRSRGRLWSLCKFALASSSRIASLNMLDCSVCQVSACMSFSHEMFQNARALYRVLACLRVASVLIFKSCHGTLSVMFYVSACQCTVRIIIMQETLSSFSVLWSCLVFWPQCLRFVWNFLQ